MMDLGETHSWTLGGIVRSFFDLIVAYVLLCGSALVFFSSKLCNFFGLYMPCPCSGIFGYQNKDLCLHKLLVECPSKIICHVQTRAMSRFPFNYVLPKDQASNKGEGEVEASCGSVSGLGSRTWGNRESGCDAKGKRSAHQKQRSGVRRRRRLEYGRFSSVASPESSRSVRGLADGVPIFPFNGDDVKNEINQSLGHVDGGEDNIHGYGVFASPTSIDMSERSWYSFQQTLSFDESKDEDVSSVTKSETKTEDKPEIFLNEAKTITTLEHALEEERAVSSALQLELEKERAAAASATDEAMAMILRLQKEKASLEMETMHYHRLIEEQFAHDEDEMSVLKEILIRRERENHYLEKELEAYREMGLSRDDDLKNEERLGENVGSFMLGLEPIVHDVHVVDDEMELHEEKKVDRYESESLSSAVNTERVDVDVEDDRLREMPRIVKNGKEKLRFLMEKSEREDSRLELLKETTSRQGPLRRTSLPPPSSKVMSPGCT